MVLTQQLTPPMRAAPPHLAGRTVVVGIGTFGLQVASLLLSRIEVHHRFGALADKHQRPLTRLGLIVGTSPTATIVERSIPAFAHSRAIQRLILEGGNRLAPPLDQELLTLLGLTSQWTAPTDWDFWLRQLVRPVLADEWDHTTSFTHLHLYIVALGADLQLVPVADWCRILKKIHPAIHVNFILNEGDVADQTTLNWLHSPQRSKDLTHLFLLRQSKSNQSLTASTGEVAFTVCNFLDTLLCSNLGMSMAEQLLPDEAEYFSANAFSSLGACKLYVPIAEVSSDVLAIIAKDYIRARLLESSDEAMLPADGAPFTLAARLQEAFSGVPVRVILQRQPLFYRIARLTHRVYRHSPRSDRVPRLRLDRTHWRTFERNQNQTRTLASWWQALANYERTLLTVQLGEWMDLAARRLGISRADEQLLADLAQHPDSTKLIDQVNALADPAEKARALADWMIAKLPQQGHQRRILESDIIQTFLTPTQCQSITGPPVFLQWMGGWLWRNQADRSGFLHRLIDHYRQELAQGLAANPAYVLQASQQFATFPSQRQETGRKLQEWQKSYDQQCLAQHHVRQLGNAKTQLIQALRARPYPAALLARFWFLWMVPLIVGTIGVTRGTIQLSANLQSRQSLLVLGWTLLMIGLYGLLQGGASLRVSWWKRRIEMLVLNNLDRELERHTYAMAPVASTILAQAPGSVQPAPVISVLTGYTQALDRELAGNAQDDRDLPAPLASTITGAADRLKRGHGTPELPMPACMVYQPIGERYIREVLGGYLGHQLGQRTDIWAFQPHLLETQLTSADRLSRYLWMTLQSAIMEEFVDTVRSHPLMRLPDMLDREEYQDLAVQDIIDDLQLRARPLLDMGQSVRGSAAFSGPLTYISLYGTHATIFLKKLQQHQHIHHNLTSDPFGLSLITVINGVSSFVQHP